MSADFIISFLRETERRWANRKTGSSIYGFQFQPGTKWNPGLSQQELNAYQSALGAHFPDDLITFLRCANGTDLQMVNVYGNDDHPHTFAPGVYSYPRDLDVVQQRIHWLAADWDEVLKSLEREESTLGKSPKFIPIFSHRYVLCNGNSASSIVCSIYGSDAIVYGSSLKEYLEKEFLA